MRIHKRGPYPSEEEALAKRPALGDAGELCIEAWHTLDSCRPLGFSFAGPIPYTAVLEWSRFNRLDRDNTAMLLHVIHMLDVTRAEQLASEAKMKGTP